MNVPDLLRFGLYGLTIVVGIALVLWVRQSKRLVEERDRRLAKVPAVDQEKSASSSIRTVRGLPASNAAMARALAGIRLPVHWQPAPPAMVTSPLTLTTNRDTPAGVASLVTDEMARLGYRITPTGKMSAQAKRDDETIDIEVDASGSFVSARMTLANLVPDQADKAVAVNKADKADEADAVDAPA